jgi:hypothetical protein
VCILCNFLCTLFIVPLYFKETFLQDHHHRHLLSTFEPFWKILLTSTKKQANGEWDIKVNAQNMCFNGSAEA